MLREVLQKHPKSLDDAQFIYGSIRKFRFFENFFAQNLKTMDFDTILSLCKTFEYESISSGDFVFKKGDASNNKFYVIISGQVSIVIPKKPEDFPKIQQEPPQTNKKKRLGLKTVVLLTKALSGVSKTLQAQDSTVKETPSKAKATPGTAATGHENHFRTTKSSMTRFFSTPNRDKNEDEVKNGEGNAPGRGTKERISSILLKADNEPEELDFCDQPVGLNFVEYPSEYGDVVRKMNEGESFGELALKNNAPRSASVFCNTNCEFLIVTKQQFALIFLKKELEKEAFLKAAFPYLGTAVSSSTSFNYLLYSFKTEAHKKGAYIIKEGKMTKKDPKIYIVYQGECIIEKNLAVEVDNPYDRSKPVVRNSQPLNIAVVGKGTIFGEEIIVTKNEYNYSVKAVSDTVIVHTVAKRDFDSKFCKGFDECLLELYELKKKQRDMVFDSLKREQETKLTQKKGQDVYFMKNTQMKNVMNKSVVQGFSRIIHREQKNNGSKHSFTDLRKSPDFLEQELPSLQTITNSKLESQNILKKYLAENQPPLRPSFRVQRQGTLDNDDIKKLSPTLTSDILNMAPASKAQIMTPDAKDIESFRFFADEPKKEKSLRNLKGRSVDASEIVSNQTSSVRSQKSGSAQIDNLLKGIASRAKKTNRLNLKLVDVKGVNKSEIKETSATDNHGSFILPNESSSVNQSMFSPLKAKNEDNNFFSPQKTKKSTPSLSCFSYNSAGKTETLQDKEWSSPGNEKFSPIQTADRSSSRRTVTNSLPRIKHLNIEIDETDKSEEILKTNLLTIQQSLINLDIDTVRQSGSFTLNDSASEAKKAMSTSHILPGTTVPPGKHIRQRSNLLLTADMRKSLFSKPLQRGGSPKIEKTNHFIISLRTGLESRK